MTERDWEAVTKHLFGLFRGLDGNSRDEHWAGLAPGHREASVAAVRRIVDGSGLLDAKVGTPAFAGAVPWADGELLDFDGCRVVEGSVHKDEDGRERFWARIHCDGLEAVADGENLEDAAATARALLPRWGRQPSGHHLFRWRGRTIVLGPGPDGECVATATGWPGSLRIADSPSPAESARRIMAWLRS